jgi:hypothetical protein
MATPQLLNDIISVLLLLAPSAALLSLVIAGVNLRREGTMTFAIGGGFTKWMFWAVVFLTLQPLLSWFTSFGVPVPLPSGGIATGWLANLQADVAQFVANFVVQRLVPTLAAFFVLRAILDAASGQHPLPSILAAMFLLGTQTTYNLLQSYNTGTQYPLPACCLLIACSGLLVTVRILNEMRLDYSPIHAGFAYKTTEQLWHWRARLRCIVCSHDDAVLVQAELRVPVRCCASWAKLCARELHKVVRRYARAVRTAVVLGNEYTLLSFERTGTVLCADPRALVGTAIANGCHLHAGCCRTVRIGRRKTSGKVKPV